jgi:hypothetical protein
MNKRRFIFILRLKFKWIRKNQIRYAMCVNGSPTFIQHRFRTLVLPWSRSWYCSCPFFSVPLCLGCATCKHENRSRTKEGVLAQTGPWFEIYCNFFDPRQWPPPIYTSGRCCAWLTDVIAWGEWTDSHNVYHATIYFYFYFLFRSEVLSSRIRSCNCVKPLNPRTFHTVL